LGSKAAAWIKRDGGHCSANTTLLASWIKKQAHPERSKDFVSNGGMIWKFQAGNLVHEKTDIAKEENIGGVGSTLIE